MLVSSRKLLAPVLLLLTVPAAGMRVPGESGAPSPGVVDVAEALVRCLFGSGERPWACETRRP